MALTIARSIKITIGPGEFYFKPLTAREFLMAVVEESRIDSNEEKSFWDKQVESFDYQQAILSEKFIKAVGVTDDEGNSFSFKTQEDREEFLAMLDLGLRKELWDGFERANRPTEAEKKSSTDTSGGSEAVATAQNDQPSIAKA